MEQYAAQIIGAIVLGFLVWIARETHANGRELVSIKTRLFGDEREDGGGLAAEVKQHGARIEGLENRVTRLEVEDE